VSAAESFDSIASLEEDRKGSSRDESHVTIEPTRAEKLVSSSESRDKIAKRKSDTYLKQAPGRMKTRSSSCKSSMNSLSDEAKLSRPPHIKYIAPAGRSGVSPSILLSRA